MAGQPDWVDEHYSLEVPDILPICLTPVDRIHNKAGQERKNFKVVNLKEVMRFVSDWFSLLKRFGRISPSEAEARRRLLATYVEMVRAAAPDLEDSFGAQTATNALSVE